MMDKKIVIAALVYLVIVNLIGFIIMGVDKKKAKRGAWRIKEKTLFLFPLIGGGLGGCLGMAVFRHKTQHWYFKFGFPLITIAWAVLLWFVYTKLGIA